MTAFGVSSTTGFFLPFLKSLQVVGYTFGFRIRRRPYSTRQLMVSCPSKQRILGLVVLEMLT
jgi:hypothetical protein